MSSEFHPRNEAEARHIEALKQEHLLLDHKTRAEMNDMVMEAVEDTSREWKIAVTVLGLVTAVTLFGAWGYMMLNGLGLAGIRRPIYWGLFIVSFVFWIGISHAGTFVSAILRVFKAEFRRPFTRAAELMTTFGLAAAGLYPLVHLGRTWRFYWMMPYPNQRWLWPNWRSPLLWDFFAINTYLIGSTLYLYLPLIPDMAMARDRSTGWRRAVYGLLALGWRGTEQEWKNLQKAIQIFAWAIIPVMFSVHTIVSWDFAVAMKLGWHSTIFGPYFIIGALLSGIAAVNVVLFTVRATTKNMRYFIRPEHFDALGKLLLIISLSWAYFFFNEFILEWYGGEHTIKEILKFYMFGDIAPVWWTMVTCNVFIPGLLLWNRKFRRTPWLMFIMGIVVNIGMFAERYVIVTGALSRNRFPFDWGWYEPKLVEISIVFGTFMLFLFLYTLAARFLPLIPVWEVEEGQHSHTWRRIGKAVLPAVSDLESLD